MQMDIEVEQRPKNLLLTLPFLLLFFIQLAHHAMWRDELNVFGIAAASPTIPSLFNHVHYEGHPWLWYGLLWLVSKITTSPVIGMKVLQAFIGSGTLLMIGAFSPFSRREKVLLFLSYYFTFEYTVMSRMYGLVVLLLMLYLRDRWKNPGGVFVKAILLGLICNADLVGCILSGGLALELLLFWTLKRDDSPRPLLHKRFAAAALYLALVAFACWSLIPFSTVSKRTTLQPFAYLDNWQHLKLVVIRYIAGPYSPIRWNWDGDFWGSLLSTARINDILVLIVLGVYWSLFRKHVPLLANITFVLLMAITFGHLIYEGSVRHQGLTFLAFFASLWMLRTQQHYLPRAALFLLVVTSITGAWTNVLEWRRPFSNAQNTAQWLRQQHLEHAPIAGTADTSLGSIAELLQRPVYFLDCNCMDTFMLFSNRRDSFTTEQIPVRLAAASNALGTQSLLFIDNLPVTADQSAALQNLGVHLDLLHSFSGAVVMDEDYFVYQATYSHPVRDDAQRQEDRSSPASL